MVTSVFHANQHLRCKQTIDYVDEWFDADAEIASLSRTIPPLIAEIVKCAMNLIAFKVPKIPHAHTHGRNGSNEQQVFVHKCIKPMYALIISTHREWCLTSETVEIERNANTKDILEWHETDLLFSTVCMQRHRLNSQGYLI